MEKRKLIPYSVYLPEKHYKALKKAAKDRKASELIREAIAIVIEGNDSYRSGYNNAIADAVVTIERCKEAQMVAFNGKAIADIVVSQVNELKRFGGAGSG
jgi:hypothetical protein